MLADRGYRHVSYEDHLAVSFLKPYVQVSRRVFADPGEEKLVGPGHPRGRFPQSFPVGVLPYGEQYLPEGALDPDPVDRVFRGIRALRTPETFSCQLHGKGEWLVGCNSPVS